MNRREKDDAITAIAMLALIALLGVVFGFAVARTAPQSCELARFEVLMAPGPTLVPITSNCE